MIPPASHLSALGAPRSPGCLVPPELLPASAMKPTQLALVRWRMWRPHQYEHLVAEERSMAVEIDHLLKRTPCAGNPCQLCVQVATTDPSILARVLTAHLYGPRTSS